MEREGGGGSARRRRLSADGREAWAGLTLGAVLGNDTRTTSPIQVNRTLLDIIRDEDPNSGAYKNLINHHNNKKNWKSFKDRLRLRRAGAAWTSSVNSPIPNTAASDAALQISRPQFNRHGSTRMPRTFTPTPCEPTGADYAPEPVVCDSTPQTRGPQLSRMTSTRIPTTTESTETDSVMETVSISEAPVQNNRSQMLRRNSSRLPSFSAQSSQVDPFNQHESAAPNVRLSEALAAERQQIQRVVSSSEAEPENDEMETAEEVVSPVTGNQPVRMSLMDLLEETDRQMGWGSYGTAEEEDEEEEDGGDARDHGGVDGGCDGREYNCCVCMVRHKGAAFIPCGHTFCRLCSRELWVSRGNCPLCNGFILEILDIF